MISFSSTLLPGPAHHCREGEWSARREWVHHWWHHLTLDLRRQAMYSCGDLIFSSHMTFILAFVICYTYHGRVRRPAAASAAPCAALQSAPCLLLRIVVCCWCCAAVVLHYCLSDVSPLNTEQAPLLPISWTACARPRAMGLARWALLQQRCCPLQVWAAKAVAWALAAALAVLIVASRKHYTVDVVVAWYVVPLVFLAMERRFVTRRHDAESVRWMELSDVVISPTGSLERGTHEASPSAEAAEAASSCHASATSRQTQYQPGVCLCCGPVAGAARGKFATVLAVTLRCDATLLTGMRTSGGASSMVPAARS